MSLNLNYYKCYPVANVNFKAFKTLFVQAEQQHLLSIPNMDQIILQSNYGQTNSICGCDFAVAT